MFTEALDSMLNIVMDILKTSVKAEKEKVKAQ